MVLLPPNPLLAYDTVQVFAVNDAQGARGGDNPSEGASVSYPAVVTKQTTAILRTEDLGQPLGVLYWDVMIFWPTDPGIKTDQHIHRSNGQILAAIGPSYPRGTGAWKIECKSTS